MSNLIKRAEAWGDPDNSEYGFYDEACVLIPLLTQRVIELEQQLSRSEELLSVAQAKLAAYQGGVEVEGVVEFYPGTKIAGVFVHQKMPDEMVGGQVRVLVYPQADVISKERIVGSNKTMEVE